MRIERTKLPGVLVLTPQRFEDERGFLREVWNRHALSEAGIHLDFVQDNHSLSRTPGTIRGLHFQTPPRAQAKLVWCGQGALFDVTVDIRKGSPTYGQWFGVELSAENGCQLLVPEGMLHGFVTRAPDTEICYKCTDYYDPDCDRAVRWDSCGIDWDTSGQPFLSEKDAKAPPLEDLQSPFVWEG